MTSFEQHATTDRVQPHPQAQSANSMHNEVIEARKAGNVKPQEQPTNAMDAFGQFSIGFGQGLANFTTETLKAAGQAISHPAETVSHAIEDTKKAVVSGAEATMAGAGYVVNKAGSGDFNGIASDAAHTAQTIGKLATDSIDQFNHLSAKEKGYVFGHDVAPTVIGTIVAPELIPEGALAAGASKVMSVAGTLIKEESVVAKVATTFEQATDHMRSIADKISDLNAKMARHIHGEEFVRAAESNSGKRVLDGEIVRNQRCSENFLGELKTAYDASKDFCQAFKIRVEPVHNMAEALNHKKYAFTLGGYSDQMNIIRIAEQTGFKGDEVLNNDIVHTFNHEFGHAINDLLGDKIDRPHTPVSDRAHFKEQWNIDINKPTDTARTAKAQLEARYPGDVQAQRHEAFASGVAYNRGPSNNPHANDIHEAFKDGYYKLVTSFLQENGL
ncbi:hypothetical protein BH10CYA1_BH10CYA1_60090 [soil metagenome]